jgi:hypothetical protein
MPRMKTGRIDEAARTLVVARRQRQQISRLPESCRPALAASYAE